MWTTNAKELVQQLSSAVFYVEVKDQISGDRGIGTCFHLGSGYFATARHVIDGKDVLGVGRFDTSLQTQVTPSGGLVRTTTHPALSVTNVAGVYHHPDSNVDLSVLRLEGRFAPFIQLSLNADLLTEGELLMSEVVIMGYPPVPCTVRPHIVVFRGEISAVVGSYVDKQRHFIISGMARGGFSGGPVVRREGANMALGVVSRALVRGDSGTELGFIDAVSPKPIFEIFDTYRLRSREIEMTKGGYTLNG
jgi:S1-C subfamily serine protease